MRLIWPGQNPSVPTKLIFGAEIGDLFSMHEKNNKLAQLDFPRTYFKFLTLAGLDTYTYRSMLQKFSQPHLIKQVFCYLKTTKQKDV